MSELVGDDDGVDIDGDADDNHNEGDRASKKKLI